MLFLVLACLSALAVTSRGRSGSAADLTSFLVQNACLDAAGVIQPGRLPFEPGCERQRPLHVGEPLPWRKHDWPNMPAGPALGYQASDSLRGIHGIVQTFDFGDQRRTFGRFDGGPGETGGDGGQMLVLRDGAAFILMTEDGGGGAQWFLGPDCRAGWLVAEPGAGVEWRSRVARLRIARGANACPTAFDAAFTRWRLAELALPWREAASGATHSVTLPVLISEHYGGESIATADHLERFYFAPGLGLTRWERWEHRRRSRLPGREAMAARLAGTIRCPALSGSAAPGSDWRLVDCRTWTNFQRATAREPLYALEWPLGR